MEDVTAFQLVVAVLSANRARRVDLLKVRVDEDLDVVEGWISRVHSVLHNLLKGTPWETLHILKHRTSWNVLRKPQHHLMNIV